MSSKTNNTPVQLIHSTGVQFQVYLNQYELKRIKTDQSFAAELIEKYYEMYKQGIVFDINGQSLPSTSPVAQTLQSLPSQDIDDDGSSGSDLRQPHDCRTFLNSEDDEMLISLVAARPALYDFRIPLKDRSQENINNLWKEVISELNVQISVKEITQRWKNIRDSYIRARSNIMNKIKSGAPAKYKLIIERLKARHKHYDALKFLDDTLTTRRTTSNIDSEDVNSILPVNDKPSSSSASNESRNDPINATDKCFFNKLDQIISLENPSETPAHHFCMRLADSLNNLPRRVRNRLELEFLQKVTEAEEALLNYNNV